MHWRYQREPTGTLLVFVLELSKYNHLNDIKCTIQSTIGTFKWNKFLLRIIETYLDVEAT